MRKLAIDIETYSSVDIKTSGLYKYVEPDDFEILLFGYSYDEEPARVIDLANGEILPQNVLIDLTDSNVLKTAFNAAFEITCISKFFNLTLPHSQWECTMVRAATAGLPMGLAEVARVMKLKEQKMKEGKALIRYFCNPCKPTKANMGRVRNLPEHNLEKWEEFKLYCAQDVETEKDIYKHLHFVEITEDEKRLWELDQRINAGGIQVDPDLIKHSISIDRINREDLTAEAIQITKLNNPNSVKQLIEWLNEEVEDEESEGITSLAKARVLDILARGVSPEVERVLKIRQELSKTSVKKYLTMSRALCEDGRVRGLLQFYGAARTGRWAGRLIQVQNLPRNQIHDLDEARNLVLSNDASLIRMCFGTVPAILSELIRTAFVAKDGCNFMVADYSAIEARVIAWLADEQWVLDVFNSHGKIYEATAAQMFHVPLEQVTKGSGLRDRGKVSQLALGYQGGVAALTAMDIGNKIPDEEKPEMVTVWRKANPNIVKLWYHLQDAAIKAVRERTTVSCKHGVKMIGKGGFLFIELPSGRKLAYPRARLVVNKFGRESIEYEGSMPKTSKWGRVNTYGGKLTENIVQAIARDCLAYAMLNLDKQGYKICMHIHDEVVIEESDPTKLKDICEIMGRPIPWAEGLPLRADGYITKYYKKD